jgi:predicted RNase H-like HicB family nuclease
MYAVVIEYDPDNGSFGATSPDVGDNVVGIGKSESEAIERFRSALQGHIAFLRDRREPVPEPHHTVEMVEVAPSDDWDGDVVFYNAATGETYALDGDDDAELPVPVWEKLQARLGIVEA